MSNVTTTKTPKITVLNNKGILFCTPTFFRALINILFPVQSGAIKNATAKIKYVIVTNFQSSIYCR